MRVRKNLNIAMAVFALSLLLVPLVGLVFAQQRLNGPPSYSTTGTFTTSGASANFLCDNALCPAGFYLLTVNLRTITVAGGSAGNANIMITSNDGTGSQTISALTNLPVSVTGNRSYVSMPIVLDGATQLAFVKSVTTTGGGPVNEGYYIGLQRIR